jgi:hypothetical protein
VAGRDRAIRGAPGVQNVAASPSVEAGPCSGRTHAPQRTSIQPAATTSSFTIPYFLIAIDLPQLVSNMASSPELPRYFSEAIASNQTVVLDPPKFDLETYIANYSGNASSIFPCALRRLNVLRQAVRASTASTSSALARHTSPLKLSRQPCQRPNQAKM